MIPLRLFGFPNVYLHNQLSNFRNDTVIIRICKNEHSTLVELITVMRNA